MAAGIRFTRGGGRQYRRYRPLPALLLIASLAIASAYIWTDVLAEDTDINDVIHCDPPSTAAEGELEPAGYDALDHVVPAPPESISAQVLNAGDTRGKASVTTESLRTLGFDGLQEEANDPIYGDEDADCRGQIRFGTNGERAARTLSVLEPCFELVRDTREDASVDFVIGTGFGSVHTTPEAHTILDELNAYSQQRAGTGDSELATGDDGPSIDEELLSAARSVHC